MKGKERRVGTEKSGEVKKMRRSSKLQDSDFERDTNINLESFQQDKGQLSKGSKEEEEEEGPTIETLEDQV